MLPDRFEVLTKENIYYAIYATVVELTRIHMLDYGSAKEVAIIGSLNTYRNQNNIVPQAGKLERKTMVDIHSHILPFIDDGARTLDEALQMASIAAKNGINHIVATSHGNYYPYTLDEYRKSFQRLQHAIRERNIPVTLYAGMEIFMDDQVFSLIDEKKLLTINSTNNLLVEFPFEEDPDRVCDSIAKLIKKQYNIVLAHPERYIFIQKNPEMAYYLEDMGCVLQVNRGSILGEFGERCRNLAIRMMDDGIVKVIATDAHDTEYRSPSIQKLVKLLERRYSPLEIRLWMSENPSRIIKGYDVLKV